MPQNRIRETQSGNVFILILAGIVLFAALGITFTRSANKGTGNLSKQQAKIAAQELISFFNLVDGAYNRLRRNGCSVDDISFSNNNDSGTFVADNDSATAPVDNSCHIFDDNGGKVAFNMDWTKYQIAFDDIPVVNQANHGQIYFKITNASTVGVGTVANDIMAHLNFVDTDICFVYNDLLGWDIDYTVDDSGPITGDENTDYANKENLCRKNAASNGGQIRKIWLPQ